MTRSGNAYYGKRTLVSLFNVCFLHTHAHWSQQTDAKAQDYTRSTALMQPSFSGLFVT